LAQSNKGPTEFGFMGWWIVLRGNYVPHCAPENSLGRCVHGINDMGAGDGRRGGGLWAWTGSGGGGGAVGGGGGAVTVGVCLVKGVDPKEDRRASRVARGRHGKPKSEHVHRNAK